MLVQNQLSGVATRAVMLGFVVVLSGMCQLMVSTNGACRSKLYPVHDASQGWLGLTVQTLTTQLEVSSM